MGRSARAARAIGITLDTYGHVMPGMQEEAAEKINAGLRAALAG
jgi:hypothetical protein